MREQDDELKDLFRQKNLENAFQVDEENWKKMSAVLKNEQKDRRRPFIYLSLVLLLGLAGTWFFTELGGNENPVAVKQEQKNLERKETKKVEALQNMEQRPEVAEKFKNSATQTPVTKHETAKASLAEDRVNSALKKEEQFAQDPLVADNENIKTAKKQKTSTYSVEAETFFTSPHVQVSIKKVKTQGSSVNETEEPAKKASPSAVSEPPISKATEPAENGLSSIQPSETNTTEKDTAETHSKAVVQKQEEEILKNTSIAEPALIIANDTTLIAPSAMLVKDSAKTKQDSVANKIAVNNDSLPLKIYPTHKLFLEGGASYLPGWKTVGGSEASGLNPLAGLQYFQEVNKRIGFSLGILYNSIGHLSATSHTSTTTRIKFGEETDVTVISALKIHYLLAPLKLNYSLSRNDVLGLGYTVAYLLDAESKVETYSTGLNYSSTPVISRSLGYTTGLNSFDGQVTFCYRRRLYKEMYLNGEFFYGLRDIKNNSTYKSDLFERAYGFRLSLDINLWKK